MRKIYRKLPILLAVAAIVACARPPGLPAGEGPLGRGLTNGGSRRQPVALLVEREIDGAVMGERLKSPAGLAVDATGNIYIVDSGNDRLIKLQANFNPIVETGGFGNQSDLFDRPSFVTVDNDLNLWVSDEGNRRVSRFDGQLNYVDEIPFYDSDYPLKFGFPSGIAVADYGEVWVADKDNNNIAVFDNQGNFERRVGDFGYSGGQLLNPEKIVLDDDHNFIVADGGNRRLVVYDGYGNFSHEIKLENLQYPVSLAISDEGFWVLDGGAGTIILIDTAGKVLLECGPVLVGSKRSLREPTDIVLLSDDRLLISDSGNNRLLYCRIIYNED